MNQYRKTIEKSRDVIQKRIEKLQERIEMLHDKYPEDMFGLKADAMCMDYEDEIKELEKWLNPSDEVVRITHKNLQLVEGIRTARQALNRAEIVMRQCEEYKEADRIRSVLSKLPNVGY